MLASPRAYWTAITCIVVLTVVRIASTHLTFAQTLDEPVHVAAGHEWLTKGRYQLDFQHPPMPRALFALPLLGGETEHPTHPSEYGNDLYAQENRYIHNVAATRRGNLLFLVIAGLAVAATARMLFGNVVAWIALVLFVSIPPVLAHAGLATTDIPAAAGFALALWALLRWIEIPSWSRSVVLGATIAWGICCKYSFPLFFAVVLIVVLIARRRLPPLRSLIVVTLIAFFMTWGAFGFTFGTMEDANPYAHGIASGAAVPDAWTRIPVPAPDLLLGFLTVQLHNRLGHSAFLLGHVSQSGWWYYFPIALGVKTPIPFLLLALAGASLLVRKRDWLLIALAAAILIVGMCSRINIGIRHILPIYVPLSIMGAYAAVELWRIHRGTRIAAVAVVTWLIVSSALAHPDYLPWMNALAGQRPYRVLLDSNFDWGQDIWRLAQICRKRGIASLDYAVVTGVRPSSIGITSGKPLSETEPSRGWIVISEQSLELARARNPHAFDWLDRQPRFERVGKTLRLYSIPPDR